MAPRSVGGGAALVAEGAGGAGRRKGGGGEKKQERKKITPPNTKVLAAPNLMPVSARPTRSAGGPRSGPQVEKHRAGVGAHRPHPRRRNVAPRARASPLPGLRRRGVAVLRMHLTKNVGTSLQAAPRAVQGRTNGSCMVEKVKTALWRTLAAAVAPPHPHRRLLRHCPRNPQCEAWRGMPAKPRIVRSRRCPVPPRSARRPLRGPVLFVPRYVPRHASSAAAPALARAAPTVHEHSGHVVRTCRTPRRAGGKQLAPLFAERTI